MYSVSVDKLFNVIQSAGSGIVLDYLERLSVICSLSMAILRLSIVELLLPESEEERYVLKYYPLFWRISDQGNFQILKKDKTDTLKHIHRWCHCLCQALEETVEELMLLPTFKCLTLVILYENVKLYEELILHQKNVDLKEIIHELKNKIIEARNDFKNVFDYLSDSIPCMERKALSVVVQAENAFEQADFSAAAKIYQNKYSLQERERGLKNSVDSINSEINEEYKLNEEIESHLNQTAESLSNDLDIWTTRYNSEIEQLDVAILQMKSKVEAQKEQHEELLDMYNDRQIKVDEMQAESDERERQKELKHAQIKAAVRIQAWWRRVLMKRRVAQKSPIKNKKPKSKLGKKKSKK